MTTVANASHFTTSMKADLFSMTVYFFPYFPVHRVFGGNISCHRISRGGQKSDPLFLFTFHHFPASVPVSMRHRFDDLFRHLLGVTEQHHGVVAEEELVLDARVA